MKRPYRTEYFYTTGRDKPDAKGFPKAEVGSLAAAGRELMAQVHAYTKVRCVDRKTGRVLWEARRTANGGISKKEFP